VTLPPDLPTPTLEPSPTALPARVELLGVEYVDQHGAFNYCAPANLAMELNFWGWQGTRDEIGNFVKPHPKDKNVMPYELADYVTQNTQFNVIFRSGGTPALLKTLLAEGFPVLVEKGAIMRDLTGVDSWMGHYQVLTGYDDAAGEWVIQDSFYQADYRETYEKFMSGWRSFNYVFLVVYPPAEEARLMDLLGVYADELSAYQMAAQIASEEIFMSQGVDLFFAWFNRGTSLVALQDYAGAAGAYDQAYQVYATLEAKGRPYRITFYQTGPYFAYYYTGRYQDVINLASQTLDSTPEPFLEENFYWRALARLALDDREGAVQDLRDSLDAHPDFGPSLVQLQALGETP
jgi:tetratricopeptide (TPR) repeat protein